MEFFTAENNLFYEGETIDMDYITIALSKGRVTAAVFSILKKAGLSEGIDIDSRKLLFYDNESKIRFVYVKPSDVVTYVERGFADLGVVGKDIILEMGSDVYEIMDLEIGRCRVAVAGKIQREKYEESQSLRVATKYPHITRKYFTRMNKEIDIIKLNGSVELAPLVGLSDVIVDLVETGETLKANGLEIIEDMFAISTRLIANRVSYRFRFSRIQSIISSLKKVMEGQS